MTLAQAAAAATPALRTCELAVGYHTRWQRRAVLERVSVSVARGELVCLLGPNGIGKSTLMRTLARMQPPLWGTVELGGDPLDSLSGSELARRLGIVLADRVPLDSLRVRQIIELGRYPHSGWLGGLSSRDQAVVTWALDVVGAAHLADRDFERISDGERQRVMVARALAQEPVLLMLDEPTAFLDVPARVELMGLLRRLTRENALAVVISTHDLELALRSADRVWLLLPGGEVMSGAPEDVILAGGFAQAFDGRQIRFHPEARAFRWLNGHCGSAVLRASGVQEAMAKAVLEREGYTVTAERPDAMVLDVDEGGWRAPAEGASGHNFGSLATYLRTRNGHEHCHNER
jgi:iron complex transport system ATP-binding protein